MVKNSYKEKYERIKIEIVKNLIGVSNKTLNEVELFSRLGTNKSKDKKAIKKVFNKLMLEGAIYYDKSNGNIRLKTTEYEVGEVVLNGTRDFAVEKGERRYSVKSRNLNGAYVGDKVLFSTKDKTIKAVIYKANNPRIFECIRCNDSIEIIPFNNREADDYRFTSKTPIVLTGNEILSATVTKNEKDGYYECEIKEVIGNRTDKNIAAKIMLAANGININFSKEALEEAELIPDHVLESEIEDRVDLRDLKTFTIDSSKRMFTYDDALSVEINKEGNYLVYLHVVDVAHYVKPGSAIYNEARERMEKIYMHSYGYTHPMLPHKLSSGVCSLVQGEDRLAKTISLEFTPDGKFVGQDFFNSVIHVGRNFDAKQAERIYKAGFDKNNPDYDEEYLREFILLTRLNDFIKPYILKNINPYIKRIDDLGPYFSMDLDLEDEVSYRLAPPVILVCTEPIYKDCMQDKIINVIKFANEQVASYFPTLPFIYKTFKYPSKREIIREVKKEDVKTSISSINYARLDMLDTILAYHELPINWEYRRALMNVLDTEKYFFSTKNKGNYKRGIESYTTINSPARSFICLENQILVDKYNGYFDTDEESIDDSEKELERMCSEFNTKDAKYKKIEALCPDPSEKGMEETSNITKGVVLDKKGNTIIINVKDEGNFQTTVSNSSIEIGDEVVIKTYKTAPGITNANAKILSFKNGNNNI